MVKDDSLYIIAIVAVVAVVGLVIMATGSSTTVVAQESLPDMVGEDSSAIAGQASRLVYSKTSSDKYTGKGTTPTIVSANTYTENCVIAPELSEGNTGNFCGRKRCDDGSHVECYYESANSGECECMDCPSDAGSEEVETE